MSEHHLLECMKLICLYIINNIVFEIPSPFQQYNPNVLLLSSVERRGLGLNTIFLKMCVGCRGRDEQAVQAEGTTSGLVKCLGDNRYKSSHRKSCGPFSGFHFF